MTNRVLMVAFHFPPFGGSSGSRRTLAFSRYLPRHGWQPLILTAAAHAYEQVRVEELQELAADLSVTRAFALDAARHLSIGGRYPSALALPDRWRLWRPFARRSGLRLIRRYSPDIIWSTYPIASAHDIAADLQAKTAIPWVADMRDPMVEVDPYSGEHYPRDPRVRQARLRTEARVAASASRIVFCTAQARDIFVARYGEAVRHRTCVIANGYDEEVFQAAQASLPAPEPHPGFRLIHSGTVYPGDDRGPGALFAALARLRIRGALPAGFTLLLRATGYDAEMGRLIAASGVDDLVELAPSLPYRQALQEMLTADALLLLQGSASNPAVPAKLYEYLRARRPLLGLVHPQGASAAVLREAQAAVLALLDDTDAIERALGLFFDLCENGRAPLAAPAVVAGFSRAAQTAELGAILDACRKPRRGVPYGDTSTKA